MSEGNSRLRLLLAAAITARAGRSGPLTRGTAGAIEGRGEAVDPKRL